jgi:hypothetical protein
MTKLTEEQKQQIKAADKPNTQLAKEFGVSAVTVGKVRGKALPKASSGVEIRLEGDSLVIKLPKKALTKKLLADLL